MTTLTTLIPAYKPDFLEETFLGLATQTWRDFRVVVSDDSPDGAIAALLRGGRLEPLLRTLHVTLVQGPRLGSMNNIRHLLALWNGGTPLVHVQLDDDVAYPDFYREHVRLHGKAALGASVSQRWITRPDGRPGSTLPVPDFIDNADARAMLVPADLLFRSTVPRCENWLGELSNMVFSAAGAQRLVATEMAGWNYYGLGDVGVLLDIVRDLPVAYLRDHLSGYRSSPQQTSANVHSYPLRCGFLAWVALALAAWREQRIGDQELLQAVSLTLQRCIAVFGQQGPMQPFYSLVSGMTDLASFEAGFAVLWQQLLESSSDSGVAPKTLAAVA